MAKNSDPGSDADRRALREALAAIPPQAEPARAKPSSPPRERVEKPAPAVASAAAGERDDEAIIKHITSLGSYMTRRMDQVDHRLDELADLLESLLSSLLEFLLANLPDANDAGPPANGEQPTPHETDPRSLADPR